MVSGAGGQAVDVRTDIPGRVPGLSLGGGRESVAGRCSILKIHAGGQSMLGSTEPLSVAEKLAIKVAGLVMATGGPVTGGGGTGI